MKFQIAVSHSIPSRIVRGNARQAKYVGSGPIRSGLVRSGLTLIEIMIALTMTLIVLGAMMTAFQYASEQMTMGRAKLELTNRMRGVENLLRSDLANLTVEPRPYIEGTIPNGYFEYVEGPRRDLRSPFGVDGDGDGITTDFDQDDTDINNRTFKAGFNPAESRINYLGDFDDILAMTVRSSAGQTFRGRFYNVSTNAAIDGRVDLIESPYAEVVWWTTFGDSDNDGTVGITESVILLRRTLIINPDLTLPLVANVNRAKAWMAASDVSARMVPTVGGAIQLVANSLEDLSNRRNRFARHAAAYDFVHPFPVNRQNLSVTSRSSINGTLLGTGVYSQVFDGSDIVLTDVAAFDLKVFSPDCWVGNVDGILVEPSDPNFDSFDGDGDGIPFTFDPDENTAVVTGAGRFGAFVDLAHHASGQFGRSMGQTGWSSTWSSMTGAVPSRQSLNYQFVDGGGTAVDFLMETFFDTWTPEYESDGINQDTNAFVAYAVATDSPGVAVVANGDLLIDEGTNGVDDDNMNGVDDYGERETLPPYPDPIRGLKVTLRLIEKNTQQLEQTSIEHSFVPQ